jgi:hypothetical protein
MDAPGVNTRPIREFLEFLGDRTKEGWRHRFMTTNWDYLLEREIEKLSSPARSRWLPESFVFHLNGTIEGGPDTFRSPFLLEKDLAGERTLTVEANLAFHYVLTAQVIVVVGMSFECSTDSVFLDSLGWEEDWLPIGEAHWLVVNPSEAALSSSCSLIRRKFPQAEVKMVRRQFADWQEAGYPELTGRGVF